jgi:hypothetical protein
MSQKSELRFNLPSREDMLAALLKVDDNSHMQQKLYPKLLKHAGEQKVPMGIVMLLQLAFVDYTEGMPRGMVNILNARMPEFIKALSPTEEVAKATQEHWDEVIASMKASAES